jgi:hypothetical protein
MRFAKVAGCAGLAVSWGIASAQLGIGPLSSVRAGVLFPTQNSSSGTFFEFGADTRMGGLHIPGAGIGGSLEGSIDYYQSNGNRNIPVLLNARASFGKTSFAIGGGLGFSRVAGSGESVGFDAEFSARTQLSTGPLPLYLEARYNHSARRAVRGVAVMLGLRF